MALYLTAQSLNSSHVSALQQDFQPVAESNFFMKIVTCRYKQRQWRLSSEALASCFPPSSLVPLRQICRQIRHRRPVTPMSSSNHNILLEWPCEHKQLFVGCFLFVHCGISGCTYSSHQQTGDISEHFHRRSRKHAELVEKALFTVHIPGHSDPYLCR